MSEKHRLVEVEDVDDCDMSIEEKNHLGDSSINKEGDVAIDNFMSTLSDKDSKVRKDMLRSSRYSMMAGEHGLTVNQGALAILSTCVGGGIVAIPLATFNLGIPLAICLQLGVIFVTHLSSKLYLGMRDLVPDKPDSLYELGYMCVGRGSIFFLASIFITNAFGLCIIYFIVFG